MFGGEGGIRTLDRVAPILHFECSALDRTMRPLLFASVNRPIVTENTML